MHLLTRCALALLALLAGLPAHAAIKVLGASGKVRYNSSR